MLENTFIQRLLSTRLVKINEVRESHLNDYERVVAKLCEMYKITSPKVILTYSSSKKTEIIKAERDYYLIHDGYLTYCLYQLSLIANALEIGPQIGLPSKPKSQRQIFSEDASDPCLLIFAHKVLAENFRQLGKSTEAVYFACRYLEGKSFFDDYLGTISLPEVVHNTNGDTSVQDICVIAHEVSHKILDEQPKIRHEQEKATNNYINYFFESHPLLNEFLSHDAAFQITLKKRFGDWEFNFDEKKRLVTEIACDDLASIYTFLYARGVGDVNPVVALSAIWMWQLNLWFIRMVEYTSMFYKRGEKASLKLNREFLFHKIRHRRRESHGYFILENYGYLDKKIQDAEGQEYDFADLTYVQYQKMMDLHFDRYIDTLGAVQAEINQLRNESLTQITSSILLKIGEKPELLHSTDWLTFVDKVTGWGQ